MVKKWFIIIAILAVLIAGSILEDRFVNKAFDEMVSDLNTYVIMLNESESDISTKENVDYLENLHKDFHEKEKLLKILIWHTGLKDIEVSISRIKSYVVENDFTEAITETKALIDYCEHYSLDFDISAENVL